MRLVNNLPPPPPGTSIFFAHAPELLGEKELDARLIVLDGQ